MWMNLVKTNVLRFHFYWSSLIQKAIVEGGVLSCRNSCQNRHISSGPSCVKRLLAWASPNLGSVILRNLQIPSGSKVSTKIWSSKTPCDTKRGTMTTTPIGAVVSVFGTDSPDFGCSCEHHQCGSFIDYDTMIWFKLMTIERSKSIIVCLLCDKCHSPCLSNR